MIEQVLQTLDGIIERAWQERSRLGCFAALYRRVTRRVEAGIHSGRFQDGPRMDRFDAIFAERYFDALRTFRSGGRATRSWMIAFHAASKPEPLVVQHLLLGMNAHINLDLGIAAAAVSPGDALPALHSDFIEINRILAGEVQGVQRSLAQITPLMHLLTQTELQTDDRIINFKLTKARDFAWAAAQRLAHGDSLRNELRIAALDSAVSLLGNTVAYPPPRTAATLAIVRSTEEPDVRRVIELLASEEAQAGA
jgi:hypothetical protein